MKLSAYPKYKFSGVEWLGDVPENWEVKRLKYIAERSDTKLEVDEDNSAPYIGLENVESWTGKLLPLNEDLIPTGISNRFKKGNLLFGKLRPYLAKACTPNFDGVCSTELLVLDSPKHDSRFLRFTLLTRGFISLVDAATYGVKMPRANWDFIGVCGLPLPPLAEQRAIVNFLEARTAKIDALLTKRWALIEKLKEKRTALISRAVTRGLNPKAKFKFSGIAWLGEIPKHWEVKKPQYLFRFVSGGTPSTDVVEYWDGNLPWASSKDMKVLHLADTEDHITELALKESATTLVQPETLLLVTRSGILRHSIPVAVTVRKMTINQDIKGAIPLKQNTISVYYFAWLVEGNQSQLLTEWRKEGATVESLELDLIKNHPLPLPPIAEQQAIAEFLDRETGKIDRMVEKVETAIETLQEYRTALITAAVTGKIDVRKAAA